MSAGQHRRLHVQTVIQALEVVDFDPAFLAARAPLSHPPSQNSKNALVVPRSGTADNRGPDDPDCVRYGSRCQPHLEPGVSPVNGETLTILALGGYGSVVKAFLCRTGVAPHSCIAVLAREVESLPLHGFF